MDYMYAKGRMDIGKVVKRSWWSFGIVNIYNSNVRRDITEEDSIFLHEYYKVGLKSDSTPIEKYFITKDDYEALDWVCNEDEFTYLYNHDELNSGIRVMNTRIIENNDKKILSVFNSYVEFDRLGKYHGYWNVKNAKTIRDYLDQWIKKVGET